MIKNKNQFRALLVYPNLPLMLVPPLAIGLFTRILRDQDYQIDLFDTTSYLTDETTSPRNRVRFLQARKFDETDDLGVIVNWDMAGDFRKKVIEFRPDVMFFSVVEDTVGKTLLLLKSVKEMNIPHLIGGVFPTAAPQRCIEFPEVQMIATGEGERTIVEVAEAIRTNKSLQNIKGTWCKDKAGAIFKNDPQPLVDINLVRPDFSLFDKARFVRPMGGKVFRTFPIESYRGCPYLCSYCNSPMQREQTRDQGNGNFLRRKRQANLDQEIQDLMTEYSPEFLYFVDDSFLARPKQEIYDFCHSYRKFSLPFWFNTRPENCTSEIMALLKEIGCYRISFGIECGNASYREKVLRRRVTNEKLIESFRVIQESDIPFSINLIIGMPGETRELVFETIDLVRKIRGYDTITVSIFTPYRGTVLRDVAVKNGWLDKDTITTHTTSGSILKMPPPYLSAADVDALIRVIPLYVYFPKSEWDSIKRAEIDDSRGNELLTRYSAIYKEKFLKSDQYEEKEYLPISGTGCRSNDLDSYRFVERQLTAEEVNLLTMN